MNKAAEDAIAMNEMLLMDKVQHMKRIAELEAALRNLVDAVKAGAAVSGAEAMGAAEAALAKQQ